MRAYYSVIHGKLYEGSRRGGKKESELEMKCPY